MERGELPPRYGEVWGKVFFELVHPALRPGSIILDVGGGRSPTLPPNHRPDGAVYVGLDLAADELKAAGQDAYDEIIAGDITNANPELLGRFDLILSWQVLEHVPSVHAALDTMHRYLKPGGRMVSQLSGRYAVFAILARALPYPLSRVLMSSLLDSDPADKFPTRYQGCDPESLRKALAQWSSYEITPRYKGGSYFRFWRPLERTYLVYENWTERTARDQLATHYVISAVK